MFRVSIFDTFYFLLVSKRAHRLVYAWHITRHLSTSVTVLVVFIPVDGLQDKKTQYQPVLHLFVSCLVAVDFR